MKAPAIPTFRVDPDIERVQRARVAAVRAHARRQAHGARRSTPIRDAARRRCESRPARHRGSPGEGDCRRNLGYAYAEVFRRGIRVLSSGS